MCETRTSFGYNGCMEDGSPIAAEDVEIDETDRIRRTSAPPQSHSNHLTENGPAALVSNSHTINAAEHRDDAPDPELVAIMQERVIRRRASGPKNPTPGPGRPKGSPKVPGSGRKAGTPNLMSPEFRAWLAKRAKPFELLAKVCRGDEIEDGGVKRRPTLPERMRAAETLTRKIVPDLQASKVEASGPDGAPLMAGRELSDVEVARGLAWLLVSPLREDSALSGRVGAAAPEPAAEMPPANPAPPALPVGHEEQAGSYTLRLVDRLPDGRERWVANDEKGRLATASFGRAALLARLVED